MTAARSWIGAAVVAMTGLLRMRPEEKKEKNITDSVKRIIY
jgi:hypothetical protein